MHKSLHRRRFLRLAALGGISGALAACGQAPAAQTTLAPTNPPASATPLPAPTAPATAEPTIASQVEPTAAPQIEPTAVPQPAPTNIPASAILASAMSQAAGQFLDSLSADGRSRAIYAFGDPERTRWHWTTPQGFPRNGIPLRDLDDAQRAAALALLQAGLTPTGYQKAQDIMALQSILGNDPLQYYVTVFGDPGGNMPWSWRWEGHHYSRHFTVVGDSVTMTPFFLGAWPTTTDAGLRAMAREEDAARELITSLDGGLRNQAIFDTRTLTRHVTQNAVAVTPLDSVGVAYADLAPPQRALIDEIIATYLGPLPEPVATPLRNRIETAGRDTIRFGWAGPLEPRRPHYYRIQGPTFLLEYDNSRNGATHIHSVWRDFDEDFGRQYGA